jgi:hypothetical protein
MRLHHADIGHDLLQPLADALQILDARHHAEDLPAAEALALDRLAQHQTVEGHDEGPHRQPVHRRRRDDAHLPDPRERQLQRARNGRRRQRQHMHIGLERLQPLLMRDTEMLLLIDDDEAEI